MMVDVRDTEIALGCPHCGQKIRMSLGWFYDHDTFVCVPCGTEVPLHTKRFGFPDEADEALGAPLNAIKH